MCKPSFHARYLQGESMGNTIWNRALGILDQSNTTGRDSEGKIYFEYIIHGATSVIQELIILPCVKLETALSL